MKTLHIESKLKNIKINLLNSEIEKLPKRIFIAYSIQYKESAEQIKKQIEKNKIKIEKFQQILGCSIIKTNCPVLLIGSGRFHALNLFLQAPEIYLLEKDRIIKINNGEIEKLKRKRKTALIKFLNAEKIGILVSNKPGQENLELAIKLRGKIEKKGKAVHIFLSNNIDTGQFENFNIDSWVNTACSGLALDNPNIVNCREVEI